MYYALAKQQDYYAKTVHRYIALASCIWAYTYDDYERNTSYILDLDKKGEYNYFGNDEAAVASTAGRDDYFGVSTRSMLYYS